MKKVLAVILSFVMLFSVSSVAFAAENEVTPVIVVSGMNAFPLVDENGENAFPVATDIIVSNVIKMLPPTFGSILLDDWSIFNEYGIDPLYNIFERISCDENGESVNDIHPVVFPGNAGQYKEEFSDAESSEQGVVRLVAEKIGWENTYYFYYDWRMNPLDIADELNETVNRALSETGSDKVSLFAMSFGGMIASSYLYKYGNENIKNIVYGTTAFQGCEMVGKLFSNQIDLNVSDALEFLQCSVNDNAFLAAIIGFSAEGFKKYGSQGMNVIDDYLKYMEDEISLALYQNMFADTYAHFKGMWCLTPVSYYEGAKAYMSEACPVSETFFNSVDEYIYNVQARTDKLFEKAQANGTNIYVIGAYGYSDIPVTDGKTGHSDMMLDTKGMSGGCAVAEFGKTLTQEDYLRLPLCSNKSHYHRSTDDVVDASTALLPEQTWVIKNMKHVEFNHAHESSDLALWLITSDERMDVYSNPSYPQFVEINRETGEFISLTEGVTLAEKEGSDFGNIFSFIMEFVMKILDKFALGK
ncbi:MAG: hypothetical protein IJ262_03560 [Clostridia bacterium]|nr:hypothetical protein [Clostridia bacterium]